MTVLSHSSTTHLLLGPTEAASSAGRVGPLSLLPHVLQYPDFVGFPLDSLKFVNTILVLRVSKTDTGGLTSAKKKGGNNHFSQSTGYIPEDIIQDAVRLQHHQGRHLAHM